MMMHGVLCGMGKTLTFFWYYFFCVLFAEKDNSLTNLFFKSKVEVAQLPTKD